MKTTFSALLALATLITGSDLRADDGMRNFGPTNISDITPAGSALPTFVAFGHHRRHCGHGGCGGSSSYGAGYMIMLGLLTLVVALYARGGLWGATGGRWAWHWFPTRWWLRSREGE